VTAFVRVGVGRIGSAWTPWVWRGGMYVDFIDIALGGGFAHAVGGTAAVHRRDHRIAFNCADRGEPIVERHGLSGQRHAWCTENYRQTQRLEHDTLPVAGSLFERLIVTRIRPTAAGTGCSRQSGPVTLGTMRIEPFTVLSALSAQHAVSGSALAQRLGVTRAAVWKQIETLRALGAPIEAVAGRGYQLAWPLEALDEDAIRTQLDSTLRKRLPDFNISWQMDSTSSVLLQRAAQGAPDVSICLAEVQSAGRGRRGREWISPLGGNVYFSLLKRFSAGMGALAGLSLVAGVALVQALADCGVVGAGLKWPNDVLADGRKLAGILVELGGEFLGPCYAVIGIGINLRLPDASKVDQPSVDLASLCGKQAPSRNLLIARLLTRLVDALDRFERAGFAPFREEFTRHDVLAGRSVRVQTPNGVREGVADGIDERGALRVRHGGADAVYDSAEVTVRGA